MATMLHGRNNENVLQARSRGFCKGVRIDSNIY